MNSTDKYTVIPKAEKTGVNVDINTLGRAIGVSSAYSSIINLNTGTTISVKGGSDLLSGIESYAGTVLGENIELNVESSGSSRGINIHDGGIVTITGNSNIINVKGKGIGVYLLGQPGNASSTLNADNLTINVQNAGTYSYGINAQTNSKVNLTGKTVINAQGGGIETYGSSFYLNTGGRVSADEVLQLQQHVVIQEAFLHCLAEL